MNGLNFEQNIGQVLRLFLSPRLLQTLRILSLPYPDLVSEIETASEENPFIEIEQHDKLTEYLKYLNSDKKARKEIDFKEFPGLENIKTSGSTLKQFLLDQLDLLEIPIEQKKIAELLIDEIDPHGYLKEYEKTRTNIVEELKVASSLVDSTLELIHQFEPEGIGARDVKECLLIQLKEFGIDSIELQELIEESIKNHLDDLGAKNFKKVAEALEIEESGAEEIMRFIKANLSPYPAACFGEVARQVVPSFAIENIKEEIKLVNLEEKYGPKINLSSDYQKMLRDPKTDAPTVKFLREKLEKAKEMLENLAKRGETSEAIMNIILETQKEFFEKGPAFLFPLEQKELASRLGLHPSTISRAISGKYVQTPNGLVPIKVLCPREFRGFSPQSIKSRILSLVSNENKKSPLNDDQIKELLLKEGIKIERRTIASYRQELRILSSSERIIL